jgi:hypothetical protein
MPFEGSAVGMQLEPRHPLVRTSSGPEDVDAPALRGLAVA